MKISIPHANICRKYLFPFFFFFLYIRQEVSVFVFEKRSVEKLIKPRRKETITEILRGCPRFLEEYRHPKLLQVLIFVHKIKTALSAAGVNP